MSDTVLDFLVIAVAGGALVGHPGLKDLGAPAWEAPEQLFKSPTAAEDFARRLAAVCAPILTQHLAKEIGMIVSAGPPSARRDQGSVAQLAEAMGRRFAPEALAALSARLWKETADTRPAIEAPLTAADLEAFEAASRSVDAAEFRPLDDRIAREIEAFTGKQMVMFLDRWRSPWCPPFAEARRVAFQAWQARLDVETIAQYCAAASAKIRSVLLDASTPSTRAEGRLEALRSEPTLVVFARPDTALAKDAHVGPSGGDVRIGPPQFAQEIAVYCGEDAYAGDFAWRSTGWWLVESEFESVLPRLRIETSGSEKEARVLTD